MDSAHGSAAATSGDGGVQRCRAEDTLGWHFVTLLCSVASHTDAALAGCSGRGSGQVLSLGIFSAESLSAIAQPGPVCADGTSASPG